MLSVGWERPDNTLDRTSFGSLIRITRHIITLNPMKKLIYPILKFLWAINGDQNSLYLCGLRVYSVIDARSFRRWVPVLTGVWYVWGYHETFYKIK